MKPLVFLKLLVLVLMLSGVVYVIKNMNEQSASKFFAALGVETGTAQSPGFQAASQRPLANDETKFNICKNRVRAVVWPDGRRVEESRQDLKARWLAVDPAPREINGLEVEKWFSRHCQIVVRENETAKATTETFGSLVTFEFIDGTKTDFSRTPVGGVIRADDRQFYSDDFDSAIAELVQLAQLQPVGP